MNSYLAVAVYLAGALSLATAQSSSIAWDYILPQTWSHQYPACGGRQQSPINILSEKAVATPISNPSLLYTNMTIQNGTGLSVVNTGRSLAIPGAFGYITLFGVQYNSVAMVVHSPSEHAVNGQLAAAELQLMYQRNGATGTNDVAIISMLYQIGAEDPLLKSFGLPGLAPQSTQGAMPIIGTVNVSASLAAYLQAGFYSYRGSLTTPPCSETVQWFVLSTQGTASAAQVSAFKASVSNADPANNRPLQVLNGREVFQSSLTGCALEAGSSWSYLLPQCWPTLYPVCAGAQQSPVNIDPNAITGILGYAKLWSYEAYLPATGLFVQSSGHGLYVNVPNNKLGGLLINSVQYNVVQLLLHVPSEHTFGGQRMDGELQIVHQQVGATGSSGMLIVSVFISAGSVDGSFLTQLGLPSGAPVRATDPAMPISSPLNLQVSLAPAYIGNFYYYTGSLTSPPCTEGVQWVVLQTPVSASYAQIQAFQQRTPGIPGTARPLQSLDGRPVVRGTFNTVNYLTGLSDCPQSGWSPLQPLCWSVNYPNCSGRQQSPINIPSAGPFYMTDVFDLSAAASYTAASRKSVINTGSSLQVIAANNDLGSVLINGITYYVVSYSLQCPSSHTIDGASYSCELQITHQAVYTTGTDGLLIVSVLFAASSVSTDNLLLSQLGLPSGAPAGGASPYAIPGPVSLQSAFTNYGGFYRYDGSQTAPPCRESVQWFVLSQAQNMSIAQLQAYAQIFPGQIPRPVQLTSGRGIYKSALPGCYSESPKSSWNYVLPQCWGERYPTCSSGQRQSPVNIDTAQLAARGNSAILLDHGDQSGSLMNTGNALQVSYTTGGVQFAGVVYRTQLISWHFNSEHALNGVLYAGELQITHQKIGSIGSQDLLILSVLYKLGSASQLLDRLGASSGKLPQGAGSLPLQVPSILPDSELAQAVVNGFYTYPGSLTMPPCTEGVTWIVLQSQLTMSPQQLSALKSLFPNPANNRKLQPLNGRVVVPNGPPPGGAVAGSSVSTRPGFVLFSLLLLAAMAIGSA